MKLRVLFLTSALEETSLLVFTCFFLIITSSYFSLFSNFQILEKVKLAYDLPVVTDVHESSQVALIFPYKKGYILFF